MNAEMFNTIFLFSLLFWSISLMFLGVISNNAEGIMFSSGVGFMVAAMVISIMEMLLDKKRL